MSPNRPALRYFGGKWLLAPWIISNFPEHRIYVEPFGGAASVLLRKPKVYAEVYNDKFKDLSAFFHVLRNPMRAMELKWKLELTPFSRDEFELAHEPPVMDAVENARRMIIRSFMGFGADSVSNPQSATGFRSNSNRSGTTPAHDWVNYSDNITAVCKRFQGVIIENKEAVSVMSDHDSEETLHYVDPPYVHDTRERVRGYAHEMTDDEHGKLISYLKNDVQGMVVLSGYNHSIYENLGWEKYEKKSYADGAGARTECLWINPLCKERLNRLI